MSNIDNITILFERFKVITGDALAASNLTLAAVMIGREAVPTGGPLTVKQAAEVLNVSPRTVYDLINENRLPHHRVGTGKGAIRIHRTDLDTVRQEPASPALRYLKAI